MPVPYYPQITITPNLGLSLVGMDEVVAQDMILIDAAVGGGGGGSTVKINGSPVTNPNFNGTLPTAPAGTVNVIFQVDGSGNVSAYAPAATALVINAQSAQTTTYAGNLQPIVVLFTDPFPDGTYTVTLALEIVGGGEPGLIYIGGFTKELDNQTLIVSITNNSDANEDVIVHAMATQLPA